MFYLVLVLIGIIIYLLYTQTNYQKVKEYQDKVKDYEKLSRIMLTFLGFFIFLLLNKIDSNPKKREKIIRRELLVYFVITHNSINLNNEENISNFNEFWKLICKNYQIPVYMDKSKVLISAKIVDELAHKMSIGCDDYSLNDEEKWLTTHSVETLEDLTGYDAEYVKVSN